MQSVLDTDTEEVEAFDQGFVEAVLWMRGVVGRPSLEQFAEAVRILDDYIAMQSSTPDARNQH